MEILIQDISLITDFLLICDEEGHVISSACMIGKVLSRHLIFIVFVQLVVSKNCKLE